MVEEANLDFRLKKWWTRNYLLGEIKCNDSMSEKYKKTCKYLNYVEHLLILISTITGYVSISAFASLADTPVGVTIAPVGIIIRSIIAGIKTYKSIIKKKKKKHDKTVLLGKDKLNTIEVLICKSLINSCISHDELVSVNNVLIEYNEIKSEVKNLEISVEYTMQKWLM